MYCIVLYGMVFVLSRSVRGKSKGVRVRGEV